MAQRIRCYVCNELFARGTMRIMVNFNDQKTDIAKRYSKELNHLPAEINNDSRVCFGCDTLINRDLEIMQNLQSLRLNVIRQRSTDTCMICNNLNNVLQRLSIEARVEIYMDMNIFIPNSSRVCVQHLDNAGFLLKNFYENFQYLNRPVIVSGSEISRFLTTLRSSAVKYRKSSLHPESLNEDDFVYFSSITKAQFNDLYTYYDAIAEGNKIRNITEEYLMIFLCKLRHGFSDELLKILFNYKKRSTVSTLISAVRRSLYGRFVRENIDLAAITREQFIAQHVTPFANELYNDNPNEPKAVVCVDGTYSYIEKSGNYRSLRQSYSVYKGRHLVKPILLVAPNGYLFNDFIYLFLYFFLCSIIHKIIPLYNIFIIYSR